MTNYKKGFRMYKDYLYALKLLSDKQVGELMLALFDYTESEKQIETDDKMVKLAFLLIVSQLEIVEVPFDEEKQKE